MIEVEIRGELTKEEFDRLKKFMADKGEHVESHEREMILLTDGYPGYDVDPLKRATDIRLRKTNDKCEIMVKHKVSANNNSRQEISLPLAVADLTKGKEVMKALGCTTGVWMHRLKDIYRYHDIEWSLVRTPGEHYYYEAEQEADVADQAEEMYEKISEEARALGLQVFTPEETRDYIYMLDREVNKEIEL
ncbi:MAG: CYTH domain-containing protein [Patescibacteria group bacterium]